MDVTVTCPKCGTEMLLSEGMMAFSCVECGETLFYIKGQVITKSEAKALLNKLIAKRKARLEAEAKAREEEEAAAAVAMPYSEPIAEPEHEIKKPALKLEPSEYDPNPGLKPQFYDDKPQSSSIDDEDLKAITAPISPKKPVAPSKPAAPAMPAPATMQKAEAEDEKKGKKAKADKHAKHYSKSGAGFAIFLYVLATLIYGAWMFYVRDLVEPILSKLLVNAFGDEIGGYVNLGLTIYFFVLIMFMWICSSSSFMSLGCVRKKINTKAELIASGVTILNIPNLPLMGILAANRKKFKKYRRTDKGTRFNFTPGYIATVVVSEIVILAANAHWIYFYVLDILKLVSSEDVLKQVLTLDFLKGYFPVIIILIVTLISLSRLIKVMVRGKKMKQTFTSPI